MHHRLRIAAVACVATAMTLLCWLYLPKPHPDGKTVSAAEDDVYEAMVRDIVTPTPGQAKISQLVFDDTVLTDVRPGTDIRSCKDNASKNLRLESSKLPYDSLADKVYRVFTRGSYDDSLRTDAIQGFLEKSCTVGRLSQTFHTDLPRTFIDAESIHFDGWPIERNESKSFEQLFPGANGIISFSHVGFDSTLHEAIVSTSFVCGGLCGTGSRYVLRKKCGRWKVVN
jgi:hypothetical protein